jgi:hypothetical protein
MREEDDSDGEAQYCPYTMSVYSTAQFKKEYTTVTSGDAIVNVIAVLAIFLVTCILFIIYDIMAHRLQMKVVQQAKRSNAIVNR